MFHDRAGVGGHWSACELALSLLHCMLSFKKLENLKSWTHTLHNCIWQCTRWLVATAWAFISIRSCCCIVVCDRITQDHHHVSFSSKKRERERERREEADRLPALLLRRRKKTGRARTRVFWLKTSSTKPAGSPWARLHSSSSRLRSPLAFSWSPLFSKSFLIEISSTI